MNEKLHTLGLSVMEDLQRSLMGFSIRENAFGRVVEHADSEWQGSTIAMPGLAAVEQKFVDLNRMLQAAVVPEDLVANREITSDTTQTPGKRVANHSRPLENNAQPTTLASSKPGNQNAALEFTGPGLMPAISSRKYTSAEQQPTFDTSQPAGESHLQAINDPTSESEIANTDTSTTPHPYPENYPNPVDENNGQTIYSQPQKSETAFSTLGKLADLAGAYEKRKPAGMHPSAEAVAKARQPEVIEIPFVDTDKEQENSSANQVEFQPGKTPAKGHPTLDANYSGENRAAFSETEQSGNLGESNTETLLDALTRKLQNDYERFYGD